MCTRPPAVEVIGQKTKRHNQGRDLVKEVLKVSWSEDTVGGRQGLPLANGSREEAVLMM